MAEPEKKTFKINCCHCGEPFTVRYALADPKAQGEAEVVETCLYCSQPVTVRIPSRYVREEHLLRGLKSAPGGTG